DRLGLGAGFVEGKVERQLLGRRIAGDELAGVVELGELGGIEEAEAGIRRREEVAVVELDRDGARRAGGGAGLGQRGAPAQHRFAERLFAHVPSRMRSAFSKKSGAPKLPLFRASITGRLPSAASAGTPGSISGPIAKRSTPSAVTTAPEVSPPPTAIRFTPA